MQLSPSCCCFILCGEWQQRARPSFLPARLVHGPVMKSVIYVSTFLPHAHGTSFSRPSFGAIGLDSCPGSSAAALLAAALCGFLDCTHMSWGGVVPVTAHLPGWTGGAASMQPPPRRRRLWDERSDWVGIPSSVVSSPRERVVETQSSSSQPRSPF